MFYITFYLSTYVTLILCGDGTFIEKKTKPITNTETSSHNKTYISSTFYIWLIFVPFATTSTKQNELINNKKNCHDKVKSFTMRRFDLINN